MPAMSRYALGLIALFCITFILYSPVLSASVVWDDITLLQDAVLSGWWGSLPFSQNYFRPLSTGVLLAEHQLSGMTPFLHHLVSLLLHSTNTALVAILLGAHLPREKRAWAAPALALLYGIHPAMVEGVAFISCRFDLMMTTGLLVALCADDNLEGWSRPLSIFGAFLFAAMSKESAAGFPLVLLAWHLAAGRSPRSRWTSYAAVVLAGLVYLACRASALSSLYTVGGADQLDVGSAAQHLLLVAHSLEHYLLLLLWPFTTLSPITYVGLPLSGGVGMRGLLVSLAVGAGILALIRRSSTVGWTVLAGVLALLPALNIIPLELSAGAFSASRYLVFPMAMFVIGLGIAVAPLLSWQARPAGLAVGLVWLAGCMVSMQTTQQHWQDNESLWRWGMTASPQSSLPTSNLSELLNASGRPQEGLLIALDGIQRQPDAHLPWNNAGQALFLLGDYPGAEAHFREALARTTEEAFIWGNLGAALQHQGKLDEAEQIFIQEALSRDPLNPDTKLNLAGLYLAANRPDKALDQIESASQLTDNPRAEALRAVAQEPERWVILAGQRLQQGDLAGCDLALQQATRLNADPIEVGLSRSALLLEAEEAEAAFQLLKALQQQAPDDARIPYNAGIAAMQLAGPDIARGWFQHAASLDPEWAFPRQQLDQLPPPTAAP